MVLKGFPDIRTPAGWGFQKPGASPPWIKTPASDDLRGGVGTQSRAFEIIPRPRLHPATMRQLIKATNARKAVHR